jgi:hypothetical protein
VLSTPSSDESHQNEWTMMTCLLFHFFTQSGSDPSLTLMQMHQSSGNLEIESKRGDSHLLPLPCFHHLTKNNQKKFLLLCLKYFKYCCERALQEVRQIQFILHDMKKIFVHSKGVGGGGGAGGGGRRRRQMKQVRKMNTNDANKTKKQRRCHLPTLQSRKKQSHGMTISSSSSVWIERDEEDSNYDEADDDDDDESMNSIDDDEDDRDHSTSESSDDDESHLFKSKLSTGPLPLPPSFVMHA